MRLNESDRNGHTVTIRLFPCSHKMGKGKSVFTESCTENFSEKYGENRVGPDKDGHWEVVR